MNEDFLDLLSSFVAAKARFLVIGAYAVGIHGHPRATKDLDVWVDATPEMKRAAAKSMALLEATNDYFESVFDQVEAATAPERHATAKEEQRAQSQ